MADASAPVPQPKKVKKHRIRRFFIYLVCLVVILCGSLVITGTFLIGKPIPAPDWLRAEVEARASKMLPDGSLQMERVEVEVTDALTPIVRLSDLTLLDGNGSRIAQIEDIQGQMSTTALMEGELKIKSVDISGLLVRLRRSKDGSFDVAFAEGAMAVDQAASLAELLTRIDNLFQKPQYASVGHIAINGIRLRYEDLRSDRVWIADGGRVLLKQDSRNLSLSTDFAVLSGGANVTSLEMTYESPKGSIGAQIAVALENAPSQDIALQTPALAWLSGLEAPISGSMRFDINDDASLGPMFGKLEIGQGALQPTPETRPIKFQKAQTYFTYDPIKQLISFDEVVVKSDTLSALAEGKAHLRDFENGLPQNLLAQFSFSDLGINPNGVFDDLVGVDSAIVDFRLKLDPFTMDFGQIVLSRGKTTIQADGQAKAAEDGWQVSLDAQVTQLTLDEILSYWPESVEPKARKWLSENILAGRVGKGYAALRIKPNVAPVLTLNGNYEGASLRYIKTLPVVQNASGHISFIDNRLVVVADKAHVRASQGGLVSAAGTVFEIPDITIKRPPTNVAVRTESTITAALAILNEKPFEFLTKANQPVNLADGRASLAIDIALILKDKLKVEDVDYSATGTLSSVRTESLIKNRTLAAQKLSLSVTSDLVKVSGRARLGQVPVNASWSAPLGSDKRIAGSQVTGTIELSERFGDEFGIALPAGSLSGTGQGKFSLDLVEDKPAEFLLTSDLQGLGLQFRDIAWSKPQNRSGKLVVAGVLSKPARIDNLEIESSGLVMRGAVELNESGAMSAARFSRIKVNDWLDAKVTLNGRGARRAPEVVINGGRIDLRKTAFGDRGGTGQGGPIKLALNELVINDSITLTDVRGDFSAEGAFNGRFAGKVNNRAGINGILVPSPTGTAIRITSDDAGGVLRAAGVLKKARRGSFDLTLRPTKEKGRYNGRLLVKETRIQNAPALAGLLSAVSIVGLLDQMANSGILFSEVEANFVLTPNQLILTQSSAVGPSMGLSMDGIYNLNSKKMDMQGVLSPIYMVNSIGSILTRRGEGLIGFNFRLRGNADNPQVTVNPLSALTPGMFREIFRRPPPSVPK